MRIRSAVEMLAEQRLCTLFQIIRSLPRVDNNIQYTRFLRVVWKNKESQKWQSYDIIQIKAI
jgi:hypothetical protein